MAFRVLAGELQHETNTFSRVATPLAAFHARKYLEGADSLTTLADTASELAGVQDVAAACGWTLVPTLAASATPSGLVTAAAWEHLSGCILDAADSTIDGVVLGLHGAMVCDGVEDAEGDLLARLRQRLRPGVPVAITLDLHANLTEAMARHADIILSYRTYPHVDARDVAREASWLIHRAMAGQIRPHTRLYRGAALDGLNNGRTQSGPMAAALAMAAAAVAADDGLLLASPAAGFAYADIREAGPGVTITWDGLCDGADGRADALGRELWRFIWRTRHENSEVLWSPEDMARRASAGESSSGADLAAGPLLVADPTDNPGGGSYGDNVRPLAALLAAGCTNALIATICDGESAARCHGAGVGASLDLSLGSKVDPDLYGPPLAVRVTVESLHDGAFTYAGPMYAGATGTLGPTAVVRIASPSAAAGAGMGAGAGVTVIINSNLLQVLDRNMVTSLGLDPASYATVVVKSSHHFRAAFGPLAREIGAVDSGSLGTRTLTQLPYTNVRRPVWPLDDVPDAVGLRPYG